MAQERSWNAVLPQTFTADGTAQGLITIASTAGFRTKQVAYLKATSQADLPVQVKRVLSRTLLIVGKVDNKIGNWLPLDISAYTVASSATIGAQEQFKNNIPKADQDSATYEADPVCGRRVVNVDQFGDFYDNSNPFPIIFDGTVAIGEVQIVGPSGYLLDPNTDGSVKTVQLFTLPFDTITATYPLPTQEIYKSRVGGILGVVQQTVTVNYTDATKNLILNAART